MARYVDIHLIHPVPFANLNRDDLGSPKTVTYGGVIRTRVSSQCWKRAVRLDLEQRLGDEAARTRRVPTKIAEHLVEAGWPQELADFAGAQVLASLPVVKGEAGLKLEKEGHSSVLLYLPKAAIVDLAAVCEEHRAALEKALVKPPKGGVLPGARVSELITGRTATINLFGRMLAELPAGNVDGAVQVAHAFTTHESDPQPDFFTAVDDWNKADDTGSGHMNSAEFSAGVFYRYASVNVDDLLANLGGDTEQARELIEGFLATFIEAMPQAKKNSTAPFTVPELAYVTVRADRPVSLAGAFECPVRHAAAAGGLSGPSRERLAGYAKRLGTLLGTGGRLFQGYASIDGKQDELGEAHASFAELISAALAALPGEDAR